MVKVLCVIILLLGLMSSSLLIVPIPCYISVLIYENTFTNVIPLSGEFVYYQGQHVRQANVFMWFIL